MANSVFYAALVQKQMTPLKARLGVIAPRGTAEPAEPADPLPEDELP
jgi:hypothetical protein